MEEHLEEEPLSIIPVYNIELTEEAIEHKLSLILGSLLSVHRSLLSVHRPLFTAHCSLTSEFKKEVGHTT